MPYNNPAPDFALLTSIDATEWSGVELFTRSGGSAVSFPTFASGSGIFEDAISLLNGRGSNSANDLQSRIDSASNFGTGNWTVSLDSATDKIKIECTTAFSLTVNSGAFNGLGFETDATLTTSKTATNDWTRGVHPASIAYALSISMTFSDGSNTFNVFYSLPFQDVPVILRERGAVGDADDVNATDCIEALDQAAQGSTDLIWYLNDSGYVVCEYFASTVGAITWSSTTFRDRLGFNGTETPVDDAGFKILTAKNRMPSTLFPSRPVQRSHLRVDQVSQARRLIGGGYVSNFVGSYITSVVNFDLDARLDQIDLYRHFTDKFMPYISSGERINYYQGWGDSRRALIHADVTTSAVDEYTLLFTSEDNGDQGRIRGSLSPTSSIDLVYPGDLRRKVPVLMEIEHL